MIFKLPVLTGIIAVRSFFRSRRASFNFFISYEFSKREFRPILEFFAELLFFTLRLFILNTDLISSRGFFNIWATLDTNLLKASISFPSKIFSAWFSSIFACCISSLAVPSNLGFLKKTKQIYLLETIRYVIKYTLCMYLSL